MLSREQLYLSGFEAYELGEYKRSALCFKELVLTGPFEEKYWRGLAAAEQMDQNYEAALSAWATASILSIQDPNPHLHAAECYLALKNTEEAQKALNAAESYLESIPNRDEVKDRIDTLKEALCKAM